MFMLLSKNKHFSIFRTQIYRLVNIHIKKGLEHKGFLSSMFDYTTLQKNCDSAIATFSREKTVCGLVECADEIGMMIPGLSVTQGYHLRLCGRNEDGLKLC